MLVNENQQMVLSYRVVMKRLTNLLTFTDIYYILFYSTVVDCGTLNTTMNGQVSHPNGTKFEQTATYNCNTGYNLVGDSTRVCEAGGMWSGSEPTCQGVLI